MCTNKTDEVRCQLYIAGDQEYIDRETTDKLIAMVSEISRMIAGLINHLRTREAK